MKEFMQLYKNHIQGAISSWDRLHFRGTIRWLANISGLHTYLSHCGILLKEFGKWAGSITAKVRELCTEQAKRLDIPIIYLPSSAIDKEALARKIMQDRGIKTGVICMFSSVELCCAPTVRGNRATKRLELEMGTRKCIWIYQYWNDEELGFGHTRLQTWLPLSVTGCLNGHYWLERQLIREGIEYVKDGNCFTYIEDYARAQELVQEQLRSHWAQRFETLLERNCPGLKTVLDQCPVHHYWSIDESEWATDIVFDCVKDLEELIPKLARYGIVTVQSPTVMRFLGRREKGPRPNEVVSDLRQRYEGLRLKHSINRNSVKMYNKAGNVLRTETTINYPRDFKVFRHPDDNKKRKASWQKMRKGVSDLQRRAEVSQKSNERYLDHLATACVADNLKETVSDICARTQKNGKAYRALNPWNPQDFKALQFLARGENHINGFRNKNLREALYGPVVDVSEKKRMSAHTSRCLRLLRAHGLIRKVSHTTRYQLTAKGRQVVTAVLAASVADTQQLMKMAG